MEITAEATKRQISINIVQFPEKHDCTHWVGLFRRGSMQPGEVLSYTSIQEAFFQLTEKGLSEQSNILLTDTRQQPSRFFYLVPWSGTNQGVAQKELEKTIGLWETNKIGFYIEPDLFRTPKDAADLLRSALHQIIEKAPFNDYFLLIGNNARAQLIVEALQVREALVNMDEDWQITVFH